MSHQNHQKKNKSRLGQTYNIHPISIKQIQKGHPWVTIDSFSEKFSPKEKFIITSHNDKPFALLLHDPSHKKIRARVWSTDGNFQSQIKSFKDDLACRMRSAVSKRSKGNILNQRDHFYLIFAEGDNIPGVLVHYIAGELLVQFYMDFWKQFQDYFIQTLLGAVNSTFKLDLSFENVFIQERSNIKSPAQCRDAKTSFKNIEINEFGVKYKVVLGKYYDHGIYTDMASIRVQLGPELSQAKTVLNLYSYTGAFSLFSLSLGAEKVTSVDLSESYIQWLEENLELNGDLDKEKHESLSISTMAALHRFKKEERFFDFIISDPPSSSSDGNKRSNALHDYKETLPLMTGLLSPKGYALIFLNTHKYSIKKFEDKVKQIILSKKLKLKVQKHFYLSEDCPFKKGFPEGSYLKGLLLKKYD